MLIGVPKESASGERRVAMVPDVVKRLADKGVEVVVEPGAGEAALIPDALFEDAGASVGDPWSADVVVKVAPPTAEEVGRLATGQVLVGFLAPLSAPETMKALAKARGDGVRDGGDPAHLARPVDGRAVVAVRTSRATRRRCWARSTRPASIRC